MNPKLILLAKENLKISKQNFYTNNSKKNFLTKNQKHPLYISKKVFSYTIEPLEDINIDKPKKTSFANIEVVKEGSVDTILRYGKKFSNDTIGVLNFASAKHPGGGFLNGSVAQEECLCYCSDLYCDLLNQKYYEINRFDKSKYYSDAMVVSLTTFFRNSKYQFLDTPNQIIVVSCPAVNRNIAKDKFIANKIMKNRMRKILKTFILYKQTNIILGAFGCGVFKNDANDIANMWKELIIDEEYGRYFDNISFSIIDDKNCKPFKKTFCNI